MKVATYKVPVTLSREDGNVHVQLHEDKKEFVNSDQVEWDSKNLMRKTKELADENDSQRISLKAMLFDNEKTRETFIELKYIEE